MKNLLKFFAFVALLSIAISLLYDYRLKRGGLPGLQRTPEKYTLASEAPIDPKNVTSLEALNRERRALVASVIPSVVSVKTSKKINVQRQYLDPFEFLFRNQPRFRSPQDQAMVQNSLGSGVVVTNEGHIITNNHVVDHVDDIEVMLSDGRTKKAQLVGADTDADLAVLKIDDPGVKPLRLADSDTVQVGDFVLAIGNPFGFEETVTDGIISSRGRPNRADAFGDLLQTNAAINPGNSGGPLINLRGEVVGINTAIISKSGGSQGIGFAIPSNNVRSALEGLLKQGRIIRGYLGIQSVAKPGQPATNGDGVIVDDVVPGSPAADAKLQRGDVIKRFDGRDVKTINQLRSLVSQVEVNKNVDVELVRDGKPMKVTTQIKEQPADLLTRVPRQQNPQLRPPQPGDEDNDNDEDNAPPQPQAPPNAAVGGGLAALQVEELTPDLAKRLDLPNAIHGVVVTNVGPASGVAELQNGDVIEQVNQQPVPTVPDFKKATANPDPNQPVVLSVCRHRARSFVVVRGR